MEEAKRPHGRPVAGSERSVDPVERPWPAGEQRLSASSLELSPGSSSLGVILAIDDDPRILTTLQRLFTMEGYEIKKAHNGRRGLEAFHSAPPDAVILDLMLPDIPGREICKLLKQSSGQIPVIILSAVSDVADKVLLLETGADDYITKPFSPRELLARVQAAIRRSKRPIQHDRVTFADILLDFVSMRATKKERPVALTAFEFKLIRFFLNNPDRVITREELLSGVWGHSESSFTRTVDNQILKLRQKLEDDPTDPIHFCTVHGVGYRFMPKRESKEEPK